MWRPGLCAPAALERYPALARPLGTGEATATMSRTHSEIQRLSDRIGTHIALTQANNGIQPDQVDDLLACLYGLYALLRLHFLQEEENYFTLADDEPAEHGRFHLPGRGWAFGHRSKDRMALPRGHSRSASLAAGDDQS